MDQNLPNNNQTHPSEQPKQQSEVASSKKPFPVKLSLIVGSILILIVIIVIAVITSGKSMNNSSDNTVGANVTPFEKSEEVRQATQPTGSVANQKTQTLVYGTWTGQSSVIRAVDTASSEVTTVATLPLQIKKVTAMPDKTLLYIDQTDRNDHGNRITIYDIASKQSKLTIPVSQGYGIDEYILSPDKKYIAIWEVQKAPNSQLLLGGKSRVYAVDLSRPTVKNLLYDETATLEKPIHYPRAILNNGRVFADTFKPNDPAGGTGWSYGMSVVDFDGTNKKDIETLKNGDYGTQPSLSPDGKYLLLAGYDGSKGPGEAVKQGYRQAILTPNTIEILNTESLKQFKLPNLDNQRTYSSAEWEYTSGKVIFTALSNDPKGTGVFLYDLSEQSATEIEIPEKFDNYGFMNELPDNKILIGIQDDSDSNLGNLGPDYAYAYTQFAIMDRKSMDGTFLSIRDPFAQYIGLLPPNYFASVLGEKTLAQANITPQPTFVNLYSDKNEEKENLQLYTFFLKYDLAENRLKQQAQPVQSGEKEYTPNEDGLLRCRELAEIQCREQGVEENPASEAWNDCVKTNKNINKTHKAEGRCYDSPLYIYGQPGEKIRVSIQTPIYNAVPASQGEYDITLGEKGTMHINNKHYTSIAYDYKPNARRVTAPSEGIVTSSQSLESTLRYFALRLGLNKIETEDLVSAGLTKVKSPYVFVSFFDNETSKSILPIEFSPKPNNYYNYVFYFKQLNVEPVEKPLAPIFPDPITRTGITAVEISELVE